MGRGLDWKSRADAAPRLPLEPLIRKTGLVGSTAEWGHPNTQSEFARQVGISRRSAARAFKRGDVAVEHGDRWAAALGHHPTEIWGRGFYVGCE